MDELNFAQRNLPGRMSANVRHMQMMCSLILFSKFACPVSPPKVEMPSEKGLLSLSVVKSVRK